MEKKWITTEHVKIVNAPKCLNQIVALLVAENPNLSEVIKDADLSDENNKRLIEGLNKLVVGIRTFEEALLYL